VAIGKRVLSNIMAYRAGYFGCRCLEDFEFFKTATQVLQKMSDWETRNHQTAQVNCYGYGGLFNVSKAQLHRNVRSYFDLTGLNFGDNFATHPPEWSSVRSFIVTAKHPAPPGEDAPDRFPEARGDLIIALICSDYLRLGWCQAPTNSDWKELLGPGSKEGLDLVIRGSDS
jgi:hypothetical protein